MSVPISLYPKNVRNRYRIDENLEERHHEKRGKGNKKRNKERTEKGMGGEIKPR